jgi:hypothetical protein
MQVSSIRHIATVCSSAGLLAAFNVMAQEFRATLFGRVTDPIWRTRQQSRRRATPLPFGKRLERFRHDQTNPAELSTDIEDFRKTHLFTRVLCTSGSTAACVGQGSSQASVTLPFQTFHSKRRLQ